LEINIQSTRKMKILQSNTALLLLFLFCLGSSHSLFAQASLFSFEKYISPTTADTLQYRQLVSDYDTVSKYPLVIFLHGSGERGNDNEAQLKWGVMNFASTENMKMHRPIVIAPQCPKGMRWGNFSEENMALLPRPTLPMQLLRELIQQAISQLPIDPNRIYITGLSMGGFGTFDALARYPDLFAAAVPVCGGGDVTQAAKFSHVPLWIFHGARDTAVSPVLSHEMVAALTKAGAYPGFTQYPEAGHFSWVAAYSDAMMMDWLFRQQK
jgi:predicted peptidase